MEKRKFKLITVKVSPELHELFKKYAAETGIENVSTVVRSLVVRALNQVKFTCVKCDCPIDEQDRFCRNCGFKFKPQKAKR